MCDIGYHICPECQDEIKCYQSEYECATTAHLEWICERCEYWMEELQREDDNRRERQEWEQREWERLYGKYSS